MLQISNITKIYADNIKALNNISLAIDQGVFGLLGPNGAGKSSLMRTIATLQQPDEGSILLNNLDVLKNPGKARQLIGYLPQDVGVYPRVTAYEMLDYLAGLKGLSLQQRNSQLMDRLVHVNLEHAAKQRLDTFSGGMRRRFGIAAAFLGDPALVIVDEPTAGLDPAERRRFQLLLAEAAQRCILILSSHIVEDLAGLCTDLAIINKGAIIQQGDPLLVLEELTGTVWQQEVDLQSLTELKSQYHVLSWRPNRGKLLVRIMAELSTQEAAEKGFSATQPDLEDIYALKIGGQ